MSRKTFTCDKSELVIDLFGAQIYSFRTFSAGEFFFQSVLGAAHAGIPLCAPWFGIGQNGASHPHTHGLVKRALWKLVKEDVSAEEIKLELALKSADLADLPGFSGYEGLDYRLFVTANETLQLKLCFSASQEVSVDAAFHTYFAIPLPVGVDLAPSIQRNYVANTEGSFAGNFLVAGYRDSVFLGGAKNPITLANDERSFTITSDAPDAVVWNPGKNDSRLAPGEWQQFVCVETGAIQDNALLLSAGEQKEISVEIALKLNS